jgi:hypothetical protein
MALKPFVGPWPLFRFLNLFTQLVGLLGRGISPSQVRYLHTGQAQTQNKRKQTSMPPVGFEHTIPAFEREKTIHAFDRAATAIGVLWDYPTARSTNTVIRQHIAHRRQVDYNSALYSGDLVLQS